jgi:hypothetical protein
MSTRCIHIALRRGNPFFATSPRHAKLRLFPRGQKSTILTDMRASLAVSVLAFVVVVGCAGSDEDGPPTMCDQVMVSGTYRITYTTVSGNCGDLPETLERVDSPDPDAQCMELAPTIVREGGCALERSFACAESATGRRQDIVQVLRIQRADGSLITGTTSLTVRQNGSVLCIGMYNTRWTRV